MLFQLLILSRLGMNRDVATCCMIYIVNNFLHYSLVCFLELLSSIILPFFFAQERVD